MKIRDKKGELDDGEHRDQSWEAVLEACIEIDGPLACDIIRGDDCESAGQ